MPLIVIPFIIIILVSIAISSIVLAIGGVFIAVFLALFARNFLWSMYAIVATRIYGTADLSSLDIAQFARTIIDTSDELGPIRTSNLRSMDVDREDFLWKYLSKEKTGRMTEIIRLRPNRELERRIYGFDVDAKSDSSAYHKHIFSCYISSDNQIHFSIFRKKHISFYNTKSILKNVKRMQKYAEVFEAEADKQRADDMKAQDAESRTRVREIENEIEKKQKLLEKLKGKHR